MPEQVTSEIELETGAAGLAREAEEAAASAPSADAEVEGFSQFAYDAAARSAILGAAATHVTRFGLDPADEAAFKLKFNLSTSPMPGFEMGQFRG